MIPICDDCWRAHQGRRTPVRWRDVHRQGAYLIEQCAMCSNPTRGIRMRETK